MSCVYNINNNNNNNESQIWWLILPQTFMILVWISETIPKFMPREEEAKHVQNTRFNALKLS